MTLFPPLMMPEASPPVLAATIVLVTFAETSTTDSPPPEPAVLPVTVALRSVVVPSSEARPPPLPVVAVLPVIVAFVTVNVAPWLSTPPPSLTAVLPLTRQSTRVVLAVLNRVAMPPPRSVAVFPRTVTSLRVRVPPSFAHAAADGGQPSLTVRPAIAADAPSMTKTPLVPPPLTVRKLAPGPVIVVVSVPVRASGPPVSVIVCGESNRPEKTIVSA